MVAEEGGPQEQGTSQGVEEVEAGVGEDPPKIPARQRKILKSKRRRRTRLLNLQTLVQGNNRLGPRRHNRKVHRRIPLPAMRKICQKLPVPKLVLLAPLKLHPRLPLPKHLHFPKDSTMLWLWCKIPFVKPNITCILDLETATPNYPLFEKNFKTTKRN